MRTWGVVGVLALCGRELPAQAHGTAFLQYVRSFGTRATYQLGSVNRVMIAAGGPWAGGNVRVHVMASAEPLTLGDRGTPQPLQVAFTSNGETITDHAHPSRWIMELAASYERVVSGGVTASFYGAAIGAPALGPAPYQHRGSAAANPAVPLGHHAQDVTHSSFGVVTLGLASARVRLEGSAFNERHPVEPGTVFSYRGARLDAYAARATIAAGSKWSVSGSYGYLPATTGGGTGGGGHSHGALHRFGAAAVYDAQPWFVTIVYGANDPLGRAGARPSLLAEAQRHWSAGHVLFVRAEFVQRTAEELSLVGSVNATQDIGALQAGYGRALASVDRKPVRLGAYLSLAVIPPQLRPFYGSRTPCTIAAYGQL